MFAQPESRIITVKQALEAWATGDFIWSIQMSGRDDEFEIAIHDMGMEVLHYMHHNKPDFMRFETHPFYYANYMRLMGKEMHKKDQAKGLNENQHTAAVHLAMMFMRYGYARALLKAPGSRWIKVRKSTKKAVTI